jgi:hypothetical protein
MTTEDFKEEEKLLERSALRALRVYGEAKRAKDEAERQCYVPGSQGATAMTRFPAAKERLERALIVLNQCALRLVEHDREVG